MSNVKNAQPKISVRTIANFISYALATSRNDAKTQRSIWCTGGSGNYPIFKEPARQPFVRDELLRPNSCKITPAPGQADGKQKISYLKPVRNFWGR